MAFLGYLLVLSENGGDFSNISYTLNSLLKN